MHLTFNGVEVRRGSFTLRADGTFGVGVHLLTGPVGSGKSTLGEVITGVISPDVGIIQKSGIRSSVLSMQFPEYHITTTTVEEEVYSWGLNPEQILRDAGLFGRGRDDILILSRGELKRLHLCCLLAGSHDLIVLDEPFAGLDEPARYWIASRLNGLEDRVMLIISHDITTLPRIDTLWEMELGNLFCRGPVPAGLSGWKNAPPLIRYLIGHDVFPSGLSWQELAEAVCRIPE